MKAIKCELCGSNEVIKQDGLYVCQHCGNKYTVEEARKMMIEGTIDVKGTVKIDRSNEIDNLLKLAQEAINSVNGEEAYSYANRVLEIEPNNAQAWFLRMKGVGLTAILKDLKVLEVVKAGNNAIKYSNNELSKDVYVYYLTKCLNDLRFCMNQLADSDAIKRIYEANSRLNAFKATENTLASDSIADLILKQVDIVVKLRESVPNSLVCSDPEISKLVGEVAKQWVYYTNALNARFNVYGAKLSDDYVAKYRNVLSMIKNGLPEDMQNVITDEKISNPSSGPCYVATAVYGSYNCPEVWTLRRFRDNTLDETWYGRAFIKAYYFISPTLVRWFGETSWFKSLWRKPLDKLVASLRNIGVEDTPYTDKY